VVVNFGEPLLADVLEGGWGRDAEAYEKNIGLRIRKGSQAIVILLPGSIK
jgi:hypothetical protein